MDNDIDLSALKSPANSDDMLNSFDNTEGPQGQSGQEMGDMAAPEVPEPPVLTLEDKRKRLILIRKIKAYLMSSFKDHLIEYNAEDLSAKSNEELAELLEEIRFMVNSRADLRLSGAIFKHTIQTFEYLGCKAGYNIQSLTANTCNDPEVNLLIEQLALEYSDYTAIKPHYKLLFIILGKAQQLHTVNSAYMAIDKKLDEPKNDTIEAEFNDI